MVKVSKIDGFVDNNRLKTKNCLIFGYFLVLVQISELTMGWQNNL